MYLIPDDWKANRAMLEPVWGWRLPLEQHLGREDFDFRPGDIDEHVEVGAAAGMGRVDIRGLGLHARHDGLGGQGIDVFRHARHDDRYGGGNGDGPGYADDLHLELGELLARQLACDFERRDHVFHV